MGQTSGQVYFIRKHIAAVLIELKNSRLHADILNVH